MQPLAVSPLTIVLIALTQAAVLWWLHRAGVTGAWPASEPRVLWPVLLLALWVPPAVLLLGMGRERTVVWRAVVLGALFLAASGVWMAGTVDVADWRSGAGRFPVSALLGVLTPIGVAWLIGVCLLRSRLQSGRWVSAYQVHFQLAWHTVLTLLQALLFVALGWLLLGLWSVLFSTLGIGFFHELFTDPRFAYPVSALAFAGALAQIGRNGRLVDGVQSQLLGLLKWLAPLATLILLVFTLALMPRLGGLLSDGARLMDSRWLLWLVAASVLLLNAAYLDGTREAPWGRWLSQAMRITAPLMAVVAALAWWSIWIRIAQHGLTEPRIWGLITASVALAYGTGYSVAALRDRPWIRTIGRVNVGMAWALFAVLLASLTPLADPVRLEVASQTRRAQQAALPAQRDAALRHLRFEAGPRGREALATLARLSDAGGAPQALREAAEQALALPVAARWERPQAQVAVPDYAAWRRTLRVVPPDATLPASLESALRTHHDARGAPGLMDAGSDPALYWGDLDGDGTPEALLWGGRERRYLLWGRAGETWTPVSRGALLGDAPVARAVTTAGPTPGTPWPDASAWPEALARGDVGTLAPHWRDLRIGDSRVRLVPERP